MATNKNKEFSEILFLVSQGKTNKEISLFLNYSLRTVERRINKLKELYKIKNRILLAQEYLVERLARC